MLGAKIIKLETLVDGVKYRMYWPYQSLRFIIAEVVMNAQPLSNPVQITGMLLKLTTAPSFEMKNQKIGMTKWMTTAAIPPALIGLTRNGKLSIWIKTSKKVPYGSVDKLLMHGSFKLPQHNICIDDYAVVPTAFSLAEIEVAKAAFQANQCPFFGDHQPLCAEIENVFEKIRTGGKRKCFSCKKSFPILHPHIYCSHDLTCASHDAEANNVTKHIFGRLQYNQGDCGTTTQAVVRIRDDPLTRVRPTIACIQIQMDLDFWGCYTYNVWINFVKYLLREKRTQFLNCRVDEDWGLLCCPIPELLQWINGALSKALELHPRKFNAKVGENTSRMLHNAFTAISQMFILHKRFRRSLDFQKEAKNDVDRQQKVADSTEEGRRNGLWNTDQLTVRLRNHFVLNQVVSAKHFRKILYNYHREMLPAETAEFWTFFRNLAH